MSRPEERRRSARILSEFPLVLREEQGALLDDRALAHDFSDKGFKIETNGELRKGQSLRFQIQFESDRPVSGRGRVVWVARTDLAVWAGLEFVDFPWSERRRLRRSTHPSDVKWAVLVDKALTACLWIAATLAVWSALSDYIWRSVLSAMAPKILATVALGWALREILRARRSD